MEFDTYTTPDAEELLRAAADRTRRIPADRRALESEAIGGAAFLLAAGLVVVIGHSARALSAPALITTVLAYLVASRVRFPVAAGWTRPTQLVFVPMLFLLPLTWVPLVVMACLLIDAVPDIVRRPAKATEIFACIAGCAHALGPVVVLLVAGEQHFSLSRWPLYLVAFVVQLVFDFGSGLARVWFAEGLRPTKQIQMLWSAGTDLCLSSGGLVITVAALHKPGLVLLVMPLIGLFGLFARERAERMENTLALSTAYRGTALLLGDVIEDDDEYTGIHSRAVVDLAIAVAQRLGLDATQRRNVEFGALLHDVGKIRVPKAIIHKPGKLSDAEWAIMRKHTVYGEQMLNQVGGTLSSVGKVVRHSHERYDGTGYPDGLLGEAIPVEARIVCACDAFNAMTTNRPYRPAMSLSDAIEEMHRCSGTHFDPRVVRALLAEVAEHPPAIPAPRAAAAAIAEPAVGMAPAIVGA